MTDGVSVNVCVVAFTYDEFIYQHDDNSILTELGDQIDCGTNYDVNTKNNIYSEDRDGWSPYEDGFPLHQYFLDSGYAPNLLSSEIENIDSDPGCLETLIKDVDLYVFDPLFVACAASDRLINIFHGVIFEGKKNFCLIMPRRLTHLAKEALSEICKKKLHLLESAGWGEWVAEDADRFMRYLARSEVKRPSKRVADKANLAEMASFATVVRLNDIPRLLERILDIEIAQ